MSGRVHSLCSSKLAVNVLPDEGGRVASLRSVCSDVEFLAQSSRSGTYVQPRLNNAFHDGACAGIEECLPTVGPSGPVTDGGPAPDHGDFWQLAWDVTASSKNNLHMRARGFSRPLLFMKELSLDGSALSIHYRVENLESEAISFLYACHPLFAVSVGDRILLPRETSSASLYYSRAQRLGPAGKMISWPRSEANIALDTVEGPESGFAEMLYTERLDRGCCGIYRTAERQGLKVTFDATVLPYLGIWLCYGGWPERATKDPQYAVALEPTNAPVNTLAEAQASGLAKLLTSGQSCEWSLRFEVSNAGVSLETFRELTYAT